VKCDKIDRVQFGFIVCISSNNVLIKVTLSRQRTSYVSSGMHIRLEELLCDAERDLLAIAKFLVCNYHRRGLVEDSRTSLARPATTNSTRPEIGE